MTETDHAEAADTDIRTDAERDPAELPQAEAAEHPVKPMKILSLWQPWASLIAWGEKKIETRSWSTNYRGPVAIHATGTIKDEAREAVYASDAIRAAIDRHDKTLDGLPLGSIVAVAEIVDCVEFGTIGAPEPTGTPEASFGDFTPGRFGFILQNVRALAEPIKCWGVQGLKDLYPEIAAQVWAALPAQDGPRLKWEKYETEDEWSAENTAGVMLTDPDDAESEPFIASFWIDNHEGEYRVDLTSDCLASDIPEKFPTLEAAQQWCEARNTALVAAAQPESKDVKNILTSAPQTPETPVGSAPRVEDPNALCDHLKEIEQQEIEVGHLEDDWDEAKEEASEAKKLYDKGVEKLRALIRNKPGPGPLFEQPKAETAATPAAETPAQETTENMTKAMTPDESWRAVTLAELGLVKPRIVKALTEHTPPLDTLGAIADWSATKGQWWATDIMGIGKVAAEEIAEACAGYWAKNPHPTQATEEAQPITSEQAVEEIAVANQQLAEVAADLGLPTPDTDFDDDRLKPGSEETLVNFTDRGECKIMVGRRIGGPWCHQYRARIGARIHESGGTVGKFPDRGAAIDAAVTEIKAWVGHCSRQGFRGGQLAEADAITRALDTIGQEAGAGA